MSTTIPGYFDIKLPQEPTRNDPKDIKFLWDALKMMAQQVQDLIDAPAPSPPAPSLFFRTAEVDVGATPVGSATFTIADADVVPTSLIMSAVMGISPSDGRDLDEIWLERVETFARPGAGSFELDMLPDAGDFSGKFVIGYILKP